jgi:putative transposase
MPRFPRLQYENAIYHIVTRGDGRRRLFHDQGHYERFSQGLADEVDRSGWVVVGRLNLNHRATLRTLSSEHGRRT